jgi:hypothetical protein
LDEAGRHSTAKEEVAAVDDEIDFLLESRP